jgi:hypothetical protein
MLKKEVVIVDELSTPKLIFVPTIFMDVNLVEK